MTRNVCTTSYEWECAAPAIECDDATWSAYGRDYGRTSVVFLGFSWGRQYLIRWLASGSLVTGD